MNSSQEKVQIIYQAGANFGHRWCVVQAQAYALCEETSCLVTHRTHLEPEDLWYCLFVCWKNDNPGESPYVLDRCCPRRIYGYNTDCSTLPSHSEFIMILCEQNPTDKLALRITSVSHVLHGWWVGCELESYSVNWEDYYVLFSLSHPNP